MFVNVHRGTPAHGLDQGHRTLKVTSVLVNVLLQLFK